MLLTALALLSPPAGAVIIDAKSSLRGTVITLPTGRKKDATNKVQSFSGVSVAAAKVFHAVKADRRVIHTPKASDNGNKTANAEEAKAIDKLLAYIDTTYSTPGGFKQQPLLKALPGVIKKNTQPADDFDFSDYQGASKEVAVPDPALGKDAFRFLSLKADTTQQVNDKRTYVEKADGSAEQYRSVSEDGTEAEDKVVSSLDTSSTASNKKQLRPPKPPNAISFAINHDPGG